MRTPDQFLAALKAAKAKFPTVNGQPLITFGFHEFDRTATTPSTRCFLQDHLAISREVDGKLYEPVSTTPSTCAG